MTRAQRAAAAVMGLLLAVVASGGRGGQGQAAVGFLSKDRIVELAAAADASVASFSPSPTALASFVALVDPVHLRMFLCTSRTDDLKLAASMGRAVEAAANPALTAEFVGVAADLSEPAALVAENRVTQAPEIVIYWMGAEVARMHPEAGSTVEEELASLITLSRTQIAEEMLLDNDFFRNVFHSDLTALECTRCHLPPEIGGPTLEFGIITLWSN
jgi:hypothetical protein